MSKYKPGTIDSYAVNERRRVRERRTLKSVNQPTGSQVYGTTKKVSELDISFEEVSKTASSALSKAEEALQQSGNSGFFSGCVVQLTTNTNPSELGVPGTWRFLTVLKIPMTDVCLYLYERVEDDNNI